MARQMGHTASDRSTLSPSSVSSFLTIADILTLVRGQWQRSHQPSTEPLIGDQIVLDCPFTILAFCCCCFQFKLSKCERSIHFERMCPISCLEDDQVRKSSLFESRYLDIDIYFLLHFPDALLELHNIYRIKVINIKILPTCLDSIA